MAEADPVILPIMKTQILQQGSPFQILFDLDSLKSDPGIGPRMLFVCFIINQGIGANEEGIPFSQMVNAAVRLIDSFSA